MKTIPIKKLNDNITDYFPVSVPDSVFFNKDMEVKNQIGGLQKGSVIAKNSSLQSFLDNLISVEGPDLDSKVDKIEGKGLSTNDFTNELKDKLDNLDKDLSSKVIYEGIETKKDREFYKDTAIPEYHGIAYGKNGMIVIASDGGGLLYTDDNFKNIYQSNIKGTSFRAVTYSPDADIFVATPLALPLSHKIRDIYISKTGKEWINIFGETALDTITGILYDNENKIIIVPLDNYTVVKSENVLMFMYSSDGVNWKFASTPRSTFNRNPPGNRIVTKINTNGYKGYAIWNDDDSCESHMTFVKPTKNSDGTMSFEFTPMGFAKYEDSKHVIHYPNACEIHGKILIAFSFNGVPYAGTGLNGDAIQSLYKIDFETKELKLAYSSSVRFRGSDSEYNGEYAYFGMRDSKILRMSVNEEVTEFVNMGLKSVESISVEKKDNKDYLTILARDSNDVGLVYKYCEGMESPEKLSDSKYSEKVLVEKDYSDKLKAIAALNPSTATVADIINILKA